jgi:hypothetical protein
MVFSAARQTIVCILLFLIPVAGVRSQEAVDKAAGSTVSGKVTVGGKGLQGIIVALAISDQYRSNFRPTRFRSTTDIDGNYRIMNVPPGSYDVIAASPTYVPTEGRKTLIVNKNETVENIDITLERGGVITGKVTDADGRPVIEEMVYLSATKTTPRIAPYFRYVRTDDRGIYRAYGVPAGSYTVSAGRDASSSGGNRRGEGAHQRTYHPSAIDAAAATVITVSEGTEATNVDITLGGPVRTYTARGRIIDSETSQPMPNTSVGLQTFFQHGMGATGHMAESTTTGEFKVENLAPGKYAVYSEPPPGSDWQSDAVQFEITDRDVDGLVIKTSKGATASGVVILEGIDDAKVRADLLARQIVGEIVDGYIGRSRPSSAINPNGSFRFTGLATGRLMPHLQPREPFRVIRLERDGIVYPRGFEIKEQDQVTGLRVVVGYANAAIRGTMKLPSGLELPTPSRLRVFARRTNDQFEGSYIPPVESDTRGNFRFDNLIPGTYEISATLLINATPGSQPQRIPAARQTVVVMNGAVADITITVQIPVP